jgi:flagellar export protein FliJ
VKPFRFALERLLKLRGIREREQARTLGDALRGEQARRDVLSRAHQDLDRAGEQVGGVTAGARPAGAVRNLRLTLQAAALAADAAAESHRESVESVALEQARFGAARTDRRVLEKLREKRRDGWNQDSTREEQRESDSLSEARRQSRREEP